MSTITTTNNRYLSSFIHALEDSYLEFDPAFLDADKVPRRSISAGEAIHSYVPTSHKWGEPDVSILQHRSKGIKELHESFIAGLVRELNSS